MEQKFIVTKSQLKKLVKKSNKVSKADKPFLSKDLTKMHKFGDELYKIILDACKKTEPELQKIIEKYQTDYKITDKTLSIACKGMPSIKDIVEYQMKLKTDG